MDPFLDLIRLLAPGLLSQSAALTPAGHWGLSFPALGDLLFVWIECGTCQLIRPGSDPVILDKGCFTLVRTSLPFTLTSNIKVEPLDSVAAVAAKREGRLTLGGGPDRQVSLHLGKFLSRDSTVAAPLKALRRLKVPVCQALLHGRWCQPDLLPVALAHGACQGGAEVRFGKDRRDRFCDWLQVGERIQHRPYTRGRLRAEAASQIERRQNESKPFLSMSWLNGATAIEAGNLSCA